MVASDELVESRRHGGQQGEVSLTADVGMQDGIELVGRRSCFVVVVVVACCRYSSQVSSRAVCDAKRVDCCKRMLELDFD